MRLAVNAPQLFLAVNAPQLFLDGSSVGNNLGTAIRCSNGAMKQPASRYNGFAQIAVADLKQKAVVGGIAVVSAQGGKFFLQMATMVVLARLLSPKDFGLQGMVLVVTGFLALFRDAGLGIATVQRLVATAAANEDCERVNSR